MTTTPQSHARTLLRTRWIGLFAVLAFVMAACSSPSDGGEGGTPLDVAGLWSGSATTEGECTDCGIVFDLEQDGTTVTGTSTDAFNDITIDLEGTIDGDVLTLTYVGNGGNTIVHEGEIDGDTITGTIEGENDVGTTLSGTFTVTRGVVDVSGSWSGLATTTACTDCGIGFDFTQDGTTVTGTSTDEVNDITIDVAGTIIGHELTLTHDGNSGNTIAYEGDVDGDVITGTIEGENDLGTTVNGTYTVDRD